MTHQELNKVLAAYARRNRNDELFQSFLKVTTAQELDIRCRDLAYEALAQIRKIK